MTDTKLNCILRGDVYLADLDPAIGSEQNGIRPVVILQNNTGNQHSSTVIAAPFTSEIKKKYLPTHVTFAKGGCLNTESSAMLEQIRVIDKQRLKKYLGQLGRSDIERLDAALRISLGLEQQPQPQAEVTAEPNPECTGRPSDLDGLPIVLSVPEAAAVLGVSRNTGYEMVKNGLLRNIRIGHTIRIPKATIQEFLCSAT